MNITRQSCLAYWILCVPSKALSMDGMHTLRVCSVSMCPCIPYFHLSYSSHPLEHQMITVCSWSQLTFSNVIDGLGQIWRSTAVEPVFWCLHLTAWMIVFFIEFWRVFMLTHSDSEDHLYIGWANKKSPKQVWFESGASTLLKSTNKYPHPWGFIRSAGS